MGPDPGTVTNVAPWILTVAASTLDRSFPAHVVFNRTRAEGQSLSATWLRGKGFYTMVNAADAAAPGHSPADAQVCSMGSLDSEKVTGKIVVCMRGGSPRVEKGEALSRAGGVGMILVNDEASGHEVIADAHLIPAVHISHADGVALLAYINSTKDPKGFITKAKTTLGTTPAPVMAAFSSQGPNIVNPEILKPDVTAPGVSVIAAWSGAAGPSSMPYDHRSVAFNTQTGTSMACPHVSGIVGLVKTLHPDWSPSAIKSAIMTTALDPGLVYDMAAKDYLNFLCSLGYNASSMAIFNEGPYRCPDDPLDPLDFNYPSITVLDLAASQPPAAARRWVRNVGPAPATYTAAVVREPDGVEVTVTPATLTFATTGEVRDFWVRFAVKDAAKAADYAFGAIVWSDGTHNVRSPLVVKTTLE
uniref:Subtilisin-like protease fibronectin type-III domain-containing protein n=1 Tax=Leersia perrieri TaxID=77586 RepID=A0A0D9WS09_9ORYZ